MQSCWRNDLKPLIFIVLIESVAIFEFAACWRSSVDLFGLARGAGGTCAVLRLRCALARELFPRPGCARCFWVRRAALYLGYTSDATTTAARGELCGL